MKNEPRISETEWEIMRALWARHPRTANELLAELAAADPAWHPKTLRTLLGRLVRKQALEFQVAGREYLYSPLVTEKECVATASESFLERTFGGSMRPMLAYFAEQRRITKADLEELRRLIDRSETKKDKP